MKKLLISITLLCCTVQIKAAELTKPKIAVDESGGQYKTMLLEDFKAIIDAILEKPEGEWFAPLSQMMNILDSFQAGKTNENQKLRYIGEKLLEKQERLCETSRQQFQEFLESKRGKASTPLALQSIREFLRAIKKTKPKTPDLRSSKKPDSDLTKHKLLGVGNSPLPENSSKKNGTNEKAGAQKPIQKIDPIIITCREILTNQQSPENAREAARLLLALKTGEKSTKEDKTAQLFHALQVLKNSNNASEIQAAMLVLTQIKSALNTKEDNAEEADEETIDWEEEALLRYKVQELNAYITSLSASPQDSETVRKAHEELGDLEAQLKIKARDNNRLAAAKREQKAKDEAAGEQEKYKEILARLLEEDKKAITLIQQRIQTERTSKSQAVKPAAPSLSEAAAKAPSNGSLSVTPTKPVTPAKTKATPIDRPLPPTPAKKAADHAKKETEKAEVELKKQEELARLEIERKAKEEADRKQQEEAARLEAERKAKIETDRKQQEEAARLEAERKAKIEADRKQQEEAARLEAERKAKEEADRKQQEEAARLESERKAKEEADRKQQEEAARLEAERKAKEDADRKQQQEAARLEAERKAKEEADRKQQEELARLEVERKAKEEADRKQQEEAARLESERKAKEEADRKQQEEVARLEAEQKARQEEADRLQEAAERAREKARLLREEAEKAKLEASQAALEEETEKETKRHEIAHKMRQIKILALAEHKVRQEESEKQQRLEKERLAQKARRKAAIELAKKQNAKK